MSPPPAATKFAFVTNFISGTVSTFSIDPQTGQLTPKGSVPTGGVNPKVIAVEPSGRFAYVGHQSTNTVSIFSINADTGGLTAVGIPVTAGAGPRFIAIGPGGRTLYTVNLNGNDISALTLDPATGALSRLNSIATDQVPVAMSFAPNGQFAYVVNFGSGDVTVYRVKWEGDDARPSFGIGVVYSQAKDGKQARMVSNAQIKKNKPLYLPDAFANVPEDSGIPSGTCAVNADKRLDVVKN